MPINDFLLVINSNLYLAPFSQNTSVTDDGRTWNKMLKRRI